VDGRAERREESRCVSAVLLAASLTCRICDGVCLSPGWSFLGVCLVLQAAERLFNFALCLSVLCVDV